MTRCRLLHILTILPIFVDFSMEKCLRFPISLRQLYLMYSKVHINVARFARFARFARNVVRSDFWADFKTL